MNYRIKISTLAYCLISTLFFSACENNSNIYFDEVDGEIIYGNSSYIRFDSLQAKYTDEAGELPFPENYYTTVVVLSDSRYGNMEEGYLYVNMNTFFDNNLIVSGKAPKGVLLKYGAAETMAAGTALEITLNGGSLKKQNGEFVIDNIPDEQILIRTWGSSSGSTGIPIASVGRLLQFAERYNGQLVQLPAGWFTGADDFSGTLQYTDGSGFVSSRIFDTASFKGEAFPDSIVHVTGICRISDEGVRVDIRSLNDLATIRSYPYTLIEDFASADITYYYGGSKKYDAGVTTDFASWSIPDGLNKAKYVRDSDADAEWLEKGATYLALMPVKHRNNDISTFYNSLTPVGEKFTKVDTVRITFAGSFMGATDYPYDNKVVFEEFNPAVHGYKVQFFVREGTYGSRLAMESGYFTDRGEWHTLTFPNTEQFSHIRIVQRATIGTMAQETSTGYSDSRLYQHGIPVIIGKVECVWNAYYEE